MTTAIEPRDAGLAQGVTLVAQAALPTMGAVLLVPVLPLISAEYGAMPGAAFWISALITVPGLCIALLSPFAGWFADRYGRRTPQIVALLFYGLAGIAPIFLSSFAAIFASRVVLGICEAVIITLSATLIGDYFEGPRRARWLAMISTVASASAVALFGISGALGDAFGWRGALAVYGIALLFLPAMIFLTWEPRTDREIRGATTATAPLSTELRVHLVRTGVMTLFGGVLFYTLVLQQGLGLAAIGTVDPARIGLLTALASAANVIGTLIFRRLTQVGVAKLMAIEFLVIGVAMVAIGQVATDSAFAAAAFVGLLGCGMLMPTLLTWTMQALPFASRARGTGVFQSMFMLGQFASSFTMIGATRFVTGDVLASFALIGMVALAAAIAAFAVHASRHRARPAPLAPGPQRTMI